MPYSVVLLDLDHTLLDTDTSLELAFGQAMAAVDVDADGLYPVFTEINEALWRRVESQELKPPEVHITRFELLAEKLQLAAADPHEMADAFAAGMGAHGDLYPGAREVLEDLAASAQLAMVTNGLGGIQRARIDRLELAGYFDAVVISGEVGVAKPAQQIFDLVFAQLSEAGNGSADPGDTLMVGDSLASDIAGGVAAGIDTCWYNPHGRVDPDHPATHVISSLAELPPLVIRE